MATLKDLLIPRHIIFGVGPDPKMYDEVTHIAVLKPSKRAKNGLFTIVGEKAFKKKLNDRVTPTRMRNEFKGGYKFDYGERGRSAGGRHYAFYLTHTDFPKKVPIDFHQYQTIMSNTNVDQGTIKQELIYSNQGFITKEMTNELLAQYQEQEAETQEQLDSIEEPRAYKKDLKPGEFYIDYKKDRYGNTTTIHLCLGILKTSKGDYIITHAVHPSKFDVIKQSLTGDHTFYEMYFKDLLSEWVGNPNNSPYYRRQTPTPYELKKKEFALNVPSRYHPGKTAHTCIRSYSFKFQKGTPKLWTLPKDHKLYGLNIFDNIPKTDFDRMNHLLTYPFDFALKNKLAMLDFMGIYGYKEINTRVTEKFLAEVKEQEQECKSCES